MPKMNRTQTPNPTPAASPADVTVLFDGACPLCAREIAHYCRLRATRAIAWVDISREPALEERFGVRPADAMARFHVFSPAHGWHDGAAAFVTMWRCLPGYRLLAGTVDALRLLPLLERLYTPFARWRLRRRCDNGSCPTRPANGAVVSDNREGGWL